MFLFSNTSSAGDFHCQGQQCCVHCGHLRGLAGTVPCCDSAPVSSLLWVTWAQPFPPEQLGKSLLGPSPQTQLEPSVPCTQWPRQLPFPSSPPPRAPRCGQRAAGQQATCPLWVRMATDQVGGPCRVTAGGMLQNLSSGSFSPEEGAHLALRPADPAFMAVD